MDLLKTFGTGDLAEILGEGHFFYEAFASGERSVIEWFLEKFRYSSLPDHAVKEVCHSALHAAVWYGSLPEDLEMLQWFVEERTEPVDVRGFLALNRDDIAHAVGRPCYRYLEAVEAEQNIVGPEVWHKAVQERKKSVLNSKMYLRRM